MPEAATSLPKCMHVYVCTCVCTSTIHVGKKTYNQDHKHLIGHHNVSQRMFTVASTPGTPNVTRRHNIAKPGGAWGRGYAYSTCTVMYVGELPDSRELIMFFTPAHVR